MSTLLQRAALWWMLSPLLLLVCLNWAVSDGENSWLNRGSGVGWAVVLVLLHFYLILIYSTCSAIKTTFVLSWYVICVCKAESYLSECFWEQIVLIYCVLGSIL